MATTTTTTTTSFFCLDRFRPNSCTLNPSEPSVVKTHPVHLNAYVGTRVFCETAKVCPRQKIFTQSSSYKTHKATCTHMHQSICMGPTQDLSQHSTGGGGGGQPARDVIRRVTRPKGMWRPSLSASLSPTKVSGVRSATLHLSLLLGVPLLQKCVQED